MINFYNSQTLKAWIQAFIPINYRKPLLGFILFLSLNMVYGQDLKLTLDIKNKTIQEALNEIEKKSDFKFFYNNSKINTSKTISINSNNQDLSSVLEQIFKGTDIDYKVMDNSIILSQRELSSAQDIKKKVKGVIKDSNSEPVVGANIFIKGTTIGTTTGLNGDFELEASDKAVLQISFLGFNTQDILIGSRSFLEVSLKEDSQNLDEVVVTALGIKREEKALGYAVQKVNTDNLTTVKTVDVSSLLSGKVAGLNVQNSTEFNEAPSLKLRGETPLLVIDGVPYHNMSLRDIAPDDVESIDVLKGATASALYGARGGSGAIMVTTRRGKKEGLSVSVNSSVMFNAGYLKKPEVQTSYSSGSGGKYRSGDYVWGDKLDIGRVAEQYNPFTYEWEEMGLVSKGKNNLQNFQELSLIANNNVSVAQKGKYGSVRASFTHVYNKGQYPNTKLNKFTYAVSGDMKWNDFTFEGGITYNKRIYPNNFGTGYGGGGILYNLLVWSGSEYDIRDYKNYWRIKDQQQNWMDKNWYDNPYFIVNEILQSSDYDVTNGFLSTSYEIKPWLKFSLRSGIDAYSEKKEWQNPISAVGGWNKKGYFAVKRLGGYSLNNDALLMFEHKISDFMFDGFVGGTMYYYQDDNILSETQNGLNIPGYYSLKASIDPAKTSSSISKKQVNSIYGKFSASWKNTVFIDVTGRNDWSSTLPKETRSYFYPSASGSLILSQLLPMPRILNFWKIRASWTKTKNDLSIYETNNAYSISPNVWDGLSTATYPTTIRGVNVNPSESRSYELGTAFNILKSRLRFDVTYYNKLYYNLTRSAGISSASGFKNTLINIEEEQVRKGVEISVLGEVVKTNDFQWNLGVNWALDRYYYAKVDPIYSTQKPWVAAGKRWDWFGVYDWERDPSGNIIHVNGYASESLYQSVIGYENPDWIWGFSNTFSYKNLTLSFMFDGRVGGVAHSVTDQALWNSGTHIESDNQYRYDEVVNGAKNYVGKGVRVESGSVDYGSNGEILRDDRVFVPNDVGVSYEAYTLNYNPYIGSVKTQNVFNQSFFKLRNLSVSYSLPNSFCNKIKSKGISIGFVGQNLLIWTKEFKYSDPDKGSDNLNSPSIRYLGFNLKVDF